MVLAAVLAFAVNLALLRSRDDTVPVVAMATAVEPGETLSIGDLKLAEVDVGPEIMAALIPWADAERLVGMVAGRPLSIDELPSTGAFVSPAAAGGSRAISVPIDPAHAVGGNLTSGDRVDLIWVQDEGATYVLTSALVLAVGGDDPTSITRSDFHVVIAVDGEQALAVAVAIREGRIEIVRSTGAAPIVETPMLETPMLETPVGETP
jgi:Flp pilus assembly protein CpaB